MAFFSLDSNARCSPVLVQHGNTTVLSARGLMLAVYYLWFFRESGGVDLMAEWITKRIIPEVQAVTYGVRWLTGFEMAHPPFQ